MFAKKPKLIKDKDFLRMLNFLEGSLGSDYAGLLLSIVADSITNLVNGVKERNVRTVEIKYNDYFSTKYDFDKMEYIDGNQ